MAELASDYSEKKDDVFSDMILVVEGKEFHVCKSTLASFSDVCNKFFDAWSESKNPIQELPGVKAHHFQLALDLIYHKIDVTDDNVEKLLKIGSYLQMKSVIKLCDKQMCEMTSDLPDNKKLLIANHYVLPNLLKHVLQSATKAKHVEELIPKRTANLSDSTVIGILQRVKDIELEIKKKEEEEKAKREGRIKYPVPALGDGRFEADPDANGRYERELDAGIRQFFEQHPDWNGGVPRNLEELRGLENRMRYEAERAEGGFGYAGYGGFGVGGFGFQALGFGPEPPRVQAREPEAE